MAVTDKKRSSMSILSERAKKITDEILSDKEPAKENNKTGGTKEESQVEKVEDK